MSASLDWQPWCCVYCVYCMQEAYRDWVLTQGKVANKNRLKMNVTTCPEPKRIKSHWDHVLEEMEWLAKDFQRCAGVNEGNQQVSGVDEGNQQVSGLAVCAAQWAGCRKNAACPC